MKSDKLSYLVLVAEIVAIVLLHSAKPEVDKQEMPVVREIVQPPMPANTLPSAIVLKVK